MATPPATIIPSLSFFFLLFFWFLENICSFLNYSNFSNTGLSNNQQSWTEAPSGQPELKPHHRGRELDRH